MEIRILEGDERNLCNRLWAQAFSRGERSTNWIGDDEGNDEDKPPVVVCGVFDSAGLQACLLINGYHLYFGENVILPMGGIGGVACLPASRGKGYAGALLKFALERMKMDSQPISALFPFSWEFYRRYGYEWVGVQRDTKMPTKILSTYPETENVRLLEDNEMERIKPIYEKFAKGYRACLKRPETVWKKFCTHPEKRFRYLYVAEFDGEIEGYVNFTLPEDGGNAHLREFVTLTPRSRRGLLGLLKRHEMQFAHFHWKAPEDDTLWGEFYHWDIETKIRPVYMGRVVDAEAALALLKPSTYFRGEFRLKLTDTYAPWNERVLRVAFGEGNVEVEETEAKPNLRMDIQAFSQLYFGSPDADYLLRAGRVTVEDEVAYHALRSLVSGPPVFTNDHF